MFRFVHTSDWQLGMPFHSIGGDAAAQLREARLAAISRIAKVAAEREASCVLVAGDMYDANTVDERTVQQSLSRIADSGLPFVVIPGNHDHGGSPDAVFRRRSFLKNQPPNLTVLERPEPHALAGGDVTLLPAPLLRRHETRDLTAWFGEEAGASSGTIRVGLAHGSVVDFSGEAGGEANNTIAPDRAERAGLDYLALGDWHGLKRVNERTWYSGAPEPTNFRGNDQGSVLLVEIEGPGAVPLVEPLDVAETAWLRHAVRLESAADIDALQQWFEALAPPRETLVRLELEGTLSLEDGARLDDLLERWHGNLLTLRVRGAGIVPAATDEELDAIAVDGYVHRCVQQLRAQRALPGPDGESAARALQLLHRLKTQGATGEGR